MATDDAMPGDYPLTLYRGDTRIWSVVVEDLDAEGVASPRDLTGHTFDAEIRLTKDDVEVMADITAVSAGPTTGVLALTLTAVESEKLIPGTAYWDLEIRREADDFVRTYLAGKVRVKGDVSRDGP